MKPPYNNIYAVVDKDGNLLSKGYYNSGSALYFIPHYAIVRASKAKDAIVFKGTISWEIKENT